MALLARLKPLNERKGHRVRIYMYEGARFYVDRGWYEVDEALAEKLRDLHQDYDDPDSPDLFDVCTREEAERLEQAEIDREASERASVARPAKVVNVRQTLGRRVPIEKDPYEGNDLTSAEVRAGGGSKPQQEMIDPEPDALDDLDKDDADSKSKGRALEVGRVNKPSSPPAAEGPRTRSRKH